MNPGSGGRTALRRRRRLCDARVAPPTIPEALNLADSHCLLARSGESHRPDLHRDSSAPSSLSAGAKHLTALPFKQEVLNA